MERKDVGSTNSVTHILQSHHSPNLGPGPQVGHGCTSERASVVGCPVISTLERILILTQMLRILCVL